METKDILLDITDENMAEAEFMCANFVEQEVKNRVFVNTLGAEAGITYLANNGLNLEDVRSIHSIKRVISRTNLADIILHNIHIDVRVVFDKDIIFVPKSHFELGITPDVYMVLLYNQDLKNMEFLGYFEPSVINKEHCNDEYYFVDIADLQNSDNFVDFVKNYSGNSERELSDSDILRGRELAVLTSDEDISDNEYKEFLNLLKSSFALRDSILEYDNFETLAGMVASFRQEGNTGIITDNESRATDTTEQGEDLSESVNDMDISLNEDLNGDDLIDDDNFGQPLDSSLSEIGDIGSGLASNEAIELAGMAGESVENHDDISDMDIGSSDIDFQDAGADFGMDVDLFDNSLDESFGENSTLSEAVNEEHSDLIADVGDNIEDGLSDVATPELSDSETEDVSDDLAQIPTEAVSDIEQDLSLDQDDLLDADLDLSADDLLSLDEDDNLLEDVSEPNSTDDNSIPDIISDGDESTNLEKMEFVSDNTEVSSYEEYDAATDDNSHKTGFEKDVVSNDSAESFDFSELGLESEELNAPGQDNAAEEENLFDFASVSEITEQPVSEGSEIDSAENGFSNEEVQFEDYETADFKDFEEITASPSEAEINSEDGEEVLITDEVINNSEVFENSTVISDKNFEPGEIILDINRPNLPEFDDDNQIGELYNDGESQGQNQNTAGLNNGVRIGSRPVLSSKYGIIGLFLIIVVAGVIIFSVAKMLNKPSEEPQPITGGLNPESKVNNPSAEDVKLNPDDVVMNDGQNGVKNSVPSRTKRQVKQEEVTAEELPSKPIPPTAFLSVQKLSWEVPDYVSYSGEFRQFFQSAGKSLKTALTSDLLLATDYTYNNVIKLSVTFDKKGKFTDAKIISSSGSSNVDKIVLQSVNQTLNILKAPNSLENNESTTVILKIYL